MSAELSKVQARVSAQERQGTFIAARVEEVAQELEGLAGQVERMDAKIERMDARIENFSQSVDQRFEHVYGQLSDIKANTVEIRNLLASLMARFEKSE